MQDGCCEIMVVRTVADCNCYVIKAACGCAMLLRSVQACDNFQCASAMRKTEGDFTDCVLPQWVVSRGRAAARVSIERIVRAARLHRCSGVIESRL